MEEGTRSQRAEVHSYIQFTDIFIMLLKLTCLTLVLFHLRAASTTDTGHPLHKSVHLTEFIRYHIVHGSNIFLLHNNLQDNSPHLISKWIAKQLLFEEPSRYLIRMRLRLSFTRVEDVWAGRPKELLCDGLYVSICCPFRRRKHSKNSGACSTTRSGSLAKHHLGRRTYDLWGMLD